MGIPNVNAVALLGSSKAIAPDYLLKALNYRNLDRNAWQ
jgi:hypothetical protein